MKRYLWTSVICFLTTAYFISMLGCMTKNQLLAEQSYYDARVKLSEKRAAQPLFEMVAQNSAEPIILQNVAAIRVFQPLANGDKEFQQYSQRDYAAPWLNLIGTTLSVGLPWFGAYKMVEAVAGIPKADIFTVQNTNSGNTTTSTTTSTFTNSATGGSVANMGGGSASLSNVSTVEAPVVVTPVFYPPAPAAP